MPELTLGRATTIAGVAVVAPIVLAPSPARVVQEVTREVIVTGILAGPVIVVRTQRSSLRWHADDVVSDRISGTGDATETGTFSGREIEITTSRSS